MERILFLSLGAAAAALFVVFRWPARQRQMLFGALFSLPIIAIEFIGAGGVGWFGATWWQALANLVMSTVLVASAGGLVAILADLTVNRWLTPAIHHRRHTLGWLSIGLAATVILALFGVSLGASIAIGLVINAVLVFFLDRALLWDAVVGAAAFSAWFVLADVLFGVRFSGDIQRLLLGTTPIGVTLEGLPLERLLINAMAGALLGPLFSATKQLRAKHLHPTTTVPRAKIIMGIAITAMSIAAMAWATIAYVLPPSAASFQPTNTAFVPSSTASIIIRFNRPVDRDVIQLTIAPAVDGTWTFQQPTYSDHGFRQATFVFSDPLAPGTAYNGAITDIHSLWGLSGRDIPFTFTTQPAPMVPPPVTPPVVVPPVVPPVVTPPVIVPPVSIPPVATKHMLAIAQDYQDSPLSCEAAALKMALAGKGVHVTERQIMAIIGYDPALHLGNIWGDPNVAFVGNIAGHQNTTGYGVYWDPIARAANHWRPAKVLTNGTPEQLAAAIYAGHPVVIWGTLGNAYAQTWKTPAGKIIQAWKGEHARTVIGVVGPADHPTSFVLNDPVVGRIVWSRATLNSNWAAFGHHGVVVE